MSGINYKCELQFLKTAAGSFFGDKGSDKPYKYCNEVTEIRWETDLSMFSRLAPKV